MKVVCDSTVLIGLARIGRLELLRQLFSEVFIPEKVYDEVVVRGKGRPGAEEVASAEWIRTMEIRDLQTVRMLSSHMGAGEAEVLVLGKELPADWLVIDEDKARDSAHAAGFKVIGLAGLLVVAKGMAHLSQVRPLLDELRAKGFRIDEAVYKEVLDRAGE